MNVRELLEETFVVLIDDDDEMPPAFAPLRGEEKPFTGPRLPVAPEFDRRRAERRRKPRNVVDRRGAEPEDPPPPSLLR